MLSNREYYVTLNLFQGPSLRGWMLKQVQHDVILTIREHLRGTAAGIVLPPAGRARKWAALASRPSQTNISNH